ncbi:FAD:protein FMN transferase [Permianibacter sp. IMCC34836]|uniref:FAD:protein FMN transferase n=1 Tax=Permianibacter fluminis TaxID=2738515 RepID=UPI001554DC31|nr:FAD:protein FMN transferase [Permianibacter fluminis]NQD38332.1 FAD:protein FMN transferase [Permianibacter fluminis]
MIRTDILLLTRNAAVSAALLFSLLVCSPQAAQAEWYSHDYTVMGTTAKVELWHDDPVEGQKLLLLVEQDMRRIDELMSPYKETSELSKLNREAAKHPVPVSQEMFDLLKTAVRFSELTDGAFDVTFSSVGYLYDYRAGKQPDDKTIAEHLPGINYRYLVFDDKKRTVRYAHEGVRVDLGGIGKGHAVDSGIALLKAHGVTHAFVNAGGDSFVLGDHGGRPWFIGIRHPRDKERQLAAIPLVDLAISTSGDYERFFIDEHGVRQHHILNPKTGKSATESQSVSIIANNSTTADALTKIFFVRGPADGMALINRLGDVSAIVVDKTGQVLYSNDLVDPRQPN